MNEKWARKNAPTAAEPPPPDGLATPSSPSVTNEPTHPPIAADADDLKAIKGAVDDAASVGGGLWLSYLFVLFYLAVAAGAVTHADLFLEKPVKLPFLNVELPLLAFFLLAPILFLFVHAYTLVHLVFLTDKAKRFDEAVRNPDASENSLRQHLPSNIFIQFLAGPPNVRAGPFGWLLRVIAWSTLAVAPILLLLLLQVQFLPFHGLSIIWTQRLALVIDLALIWWLWRKILSGREPVVERPWARKGRSLIGLVLTACTVVFSWLLATFPGEWQTESFGAWRPIHERDREGEAIMVSAHDWLFESRINDITGRRRWPLSTTVLPGFNIYEGLGIDDPEKAKWRGFVFRARGRDLRGAIFDFANLRGIDFTGARLQDASFDGAKLESVLFGCPDRGGDGLINPTSLSPDLCTQLQARLDGAVFFAAQLKGVSLNNNSLQGASFQLADLEGASLSGAQLQGADLNGAQLQGAALNSARLQGADLNDAALQGASLYDAHLQGASFEGAQLQGASLERAVVEATDLSSAWLWRTNGATPPETFSAIRMSGGESWLPSWLRIQSSENLQWDGKAYQSLRTDLQSLPPGDNRNDALKRIEILDCSISDKTTGKMLSSCNPDVPPPPEAQTWRKALEAARVDDSAYPEPLAKALRDLVCSIGEDANYEDATYIVRGAGFQYRLKAAGGAASGLIDDLMNNRGKDFPVSATLTDADRANLLSIKRDAIKEAGQ